MVKLLELNDLIDYLHSFESKEYIKESKCDTCKYLIKRKNTGDKSHIIFCSNELANPNAIGKFGIGYFKIVSLTKIRIGYFKFSNCIGCEEYIIKKLNILKRLFTRKIKV